MFGLLKNLKLNDVGKLPLWRGIYALFIIMITGVIIGESIGQTTLKELLPQPSAIADQIV